MGVADTYNYDDAVERLKVLEAFDPDPESPEGRELQELRQLLTDFQYEEEELRNAAWHDTELAFDADDTYTRYSDDNYYEGL